MEFRGRSRSGGCHATTIWIAREGAGAETSGSALERSRPHAFQPGPQRRPVDDFGGVVANLPNRLGARSKVAGGDDDSRSGLLVQNVRVDRAMVVISLGFGADDAIDLVDAVLVARPSEDTQPFRCRPVHRSVPFGEAAARRLKRCRCRPCLLRNRMGAVAYGFGSPSWLTGCRPPPCCRPPRVQSHAETPAGGGMSRKLSHRSRARNHPDLPDAAHAPPLRSMTTSAPREAMRWPTKRCNKRNTPSAAATATLHWRLCP